MRSFIDHLVIGGGRAGSMLALRLAATGREVALIESNLRRITKSAANSSAPKPSDISSALLSALRSQLRPGMRFASSLSRLMVTSAGRNFAPIALSLAPGAMSWIAAQTRIPKRALNKTHVTAGGAPKHWPAPAA